MMHLGLGKLFFLQILPCLIFCEDARRQIHHTVPPHQPGVTGQLDPLAAWLSKAATTRPNVLLLIADDLRPKLGSYGEANMITPNLDFLASKSVRFDQAFAQVALCAPSRTSFLTGRRAETTRVFDLDTYWRTAGGNFTTMPQYFREHGFTSQGIGKIYHPGIASGGGSVFDDPYSWSLPFYPGTDPISKSQHKMSTIHPVNTTETGKLLDEDIADQAVHWLSQHKNDQQPFFLAVGFHKPHLPWICPQEYFGLYPLSHIHLAKYRTRPPSTPDIAFSPGGEIAKYPDILRLNVSLATGVIPDHYQLKMRQSYSACTSYMDAQAGKVLQALSHNYLTDNTVVLFLGDHGWHLGDNAQWTKHTNFDMALRVPMMLFIPGVTSGSSTHFQYIDALSPSFDPSSVTSHFGGKHSTEELVEAIDVFPTLVELAGLAKPSYCPVHSRHVQMCLEGTSLVPLVRQVRNLTSAQSFKWKDAAFSVYERNWSRESKRAIGYTMRTKTHRYTEWVHFDLASWSPEWDNSFGVEMYDHRTDKEEFHNLAEEHAHRALRTTLSQKLRAGWRQALIDYENSFH